jgi:hypothetical protein
LEIGNGKLPEMRKAPDTEAQGQAEVSPLRSVAKRWEDTEMTPAQQREHAAWMRTRRSQTLDVVEGLIDSLCQSRQYGWESRPHEKIGDMIARLEWLRSPSAAVVPISTPAPSSSPNIDGYVTQLLQNRSVDTPMADGKSPTPSADR